MGNGDIPKLNANQLKTPLMKVASENVRLKNESNKSNNVIVITGGPKVIVADFGPESQMLKCPYCFSFITTQVKSTATTKTHLWAAVLCMCCCWFCSCCPYLIYSCQDRSHYCPHCNAYLGSYRT